MSDQVEPCTSALSTLTLQEKEETNHEEEEIDIYDPGDSDPFRRIPLSYYPDVDYGFYPPCLVFGIGLLRDEAVAMLFGYQDMASHFAELYDHSIEAVIGLSRKCDIVLALFDNYSRPKDVESRRKAGYFYWAMNESMYPSGAYSPAMYKDSSTQVLKCYCFVSARVLL
ncbi:hypothetical protein BDZ89DRAFT_1076564 [Hymenopellis radicata]|nr:hypothetical protein BDZ89DRAFT_1076564 [Hymenopellis radicata]